MPVHCCEEVLRPAADDDGVVFGKAGIGLKSEIGRDRASSVDGAHFRQQAARPTIAV
jgi:hypothetical protein